MRISPDDIQLANSALGVEDAVTLARAHRMYAPKNRSRFPRAMLDMLAKQKKVRFIGRSGVAFISQAFAEEAIKAWYAAEERQLFGDGGGTDGAPDERPAGGHDPVAEVEAIRQAAWESHSCLEAILKCNAEILEKVSALAEAVERLCANVPYFGADIGGGPSEAVKTVVEGGEVTEISRGEAAGLPEDGE